jgi:hypothetical protein
MTFSVVADWVDAPLREFVGEARVELAVLLHPNGQVLGQFGFARSLDVMTACVLSAAIDASSAELGRMVDGTPFTGLHHAGRDRQLFLGQVPVSGGRLLLLAVFDEESSLGLVQFFFRTFCADIAAAAPANAHAGTEPPTLSLDFERELNHNLAVLFGRA